MEPNLFASHLTFCHHCGVNIVFSIYHLAVVLELPNIGMLLILLRVADDAGGSSAGWHVFGPDNAIRHDRWRRISAKSPSGLLRGDAAGLAQFLTTRWMPICLEMEFACMIECTVCPSMVSRQLTLGNWPLSVPHIYTARGTSPWKYLVRELCR